MKNLHLVFGIPSPSIASESNKEFHRWYRTHLTEILEAYAWDAGRRYALESIHGGGAPAEYPFLAAYEVGPDPVANAASLRRAGEARRARPGYQPPPAWVAENRYASWDCVSLEDRGEVELPEHLYFVMTQTPEGMTFEDYSAWYKVHLEENLRGLGFLRGWRFKMIPTASNEAAAAPPWTHLAAYEVSGEIRARLDELHATREALGLVTDDWFGRVPILGIDAFAVSPRIEAPRWKRDESPEWTATKSRQKTENERVVQEFRDNKGRVESYPFPVVLLHNVGAKSGREHINPLACLPVDENLAIFGTSGGSPRPPDWYFNLLANPRATVEFGTETFEVQARVTSGEERQRIWLEQIARFPHFGHMDEVTTREIPVVLLERV